MAAADEDDVLVLVHQLPVDMEVPHEGRLAHLLPPLHRAPPPPPPPPPFRPPPPPAAAASAEPRLSFRGWLGAPRHWDLWVAKLRPLHAPLWRRLGIHDAVLASTYRFKRDASAVLHLASFWCPATATFAFPWGEATLTLHDVALLAGFPATGSPVPAPLRPEWRPDEAALNGVRLGFNRSACKKAHHSAWVKHFLFDHNDPLHEHAAFLALWLTRFVLPGHPESTMRQAVFPIAARLARGERVALAPAVLASLYRDLRDIKAFLVAAGTAAATTGNNTDMLSSSSSSLYAPLYILQLWMWERFPALRPGRDNPVRDGEPMAARWHDLSRKLNPTLIREALTSGADFVWQLPYATYLNKYSGWVCSSDLARNDELRLLAHCLRPCELVGMDCIEQYLPHRVARQFGLDQDVPGDVCRANQDWAVAWQTYELEGKNVTFFIPQSEPGITVRYAQWWRQRLPPSDLHAGAPSIPVEWKTSKRKVKKTPAAMEAEAEKERKMKKARVSPSDKKRKLDELYDPKLPGWLAAGRSGISDAAGGSCNMGSLPKYDIGSDDALLPNVGTTNDDVVLLVPRMQTATPAVVMPKKDDNMSPATGDTGKFIVDMPTDIPNSEPEEGVTAILEAEKLDISVDRSLDITDGPEGGATAVMELEKEAMEKHNIHDRSPDLTDRPEEGATAVMELEKEAMERHNIPVDRSFDLTDRPEEGATAVMELDKEASVSDRPEEVAAPVIEEKEEKAAIEGNSCATGMNPSEKNRDIVTEAGEGNKVSEEVGRAAGEPIEAVPQSQQEVDVGVVNNCHDAMPLREESLPIQHTSNGGGCSKVFGIMDDNNSAGSMDTDDKETTCHDFFAEDHGQVPCVEEIGGGKNNRMVEKDSKEMPQEAPQTEIVECLEDIVLMGTDKDSAQKELPPTVEEVVTSHSMDAALLGVGVPEEENLEVDKDLNLAKKEAEDMPIEVAEGEEAEQEQFNTLAEGGAEEDHKEFSELDHTGMADPKMHPHFNTETPEKAAEVEHADIDGAMGLTGRDANGKIGDVPEVGHAEAEEVRGLIVNDSDEKFVEVSQVEHAEVKDVKGLMMEHTNNKFKEAPELVNTGSEETCGPMEEDTDGKLKEVHDVNAEMEEANEHERDSDKHEGILQVDLTRDEARWLAKEDVEENTSVVHDVNAAMEEANEHERDSDRPKAILQVDLLTGDEARWLAKEDGEENSRKDPQLECEKLRDEAPIEEGTKEKPCADGKDLPEKGVDESKEVYKVKQAERDGCVVLMERGDENITDALGVEQEAEGHSKALSKKGTHDHVEEITLVEQVDGQSERLKRIGTEEIPEEITKALEKEFDNDIMIDSNNSTNGEMPCSSATVQLKRGTMEKQCIQNVELINQRKPPSDAAAMKVEGAYDHKTLDMHEEVALKQRQDHGIIKNWETIILEGNHMLDSKVKPDLVTLEVDETHAAGGIQNQEFLNLDKEMSLKQRQDHGIICENRETVVLEGSYMLDSKVKPDLVILEVDETHAAEGIQNQEILDLDKEMAKQKEDHRIICENRETMIREGSYMLDSGVKSDLVTLEDDKTHAAQGIENQQQGVNERQDLGTTIGNNKMIMSEDADILVCSEYQIDPTDTEVNEVESTRRIQNQELLDNKRLLAMEERQHLGTTTENSKMDMSEDADILVCGKYQIESTGTEVIEVESTKGIQNQELLDNKEDQVMEKRMECEVTDGSGTSLEEAYKVGGGGVDTCAVAVNVSDSTQNKEACSMEELQAKEDKEQHGVEHGNEKRISEDTNMIDSGRLKSDVTVVEVDMAGSREGTLNQCALNVEKEAGLQEEQNQEIADEDINRGVVNINVLQCGGVKPDGAVKMFHETLHTTQAVDVVGSKISSKNKQKEVPFEEHNITEIVGSESNQTARMEPEGALPAEPENLVEVKQENLENETERSIFRENDESSCKDQTSAEVMVAPSNNDDQGEDDNEWAEESTKSYDKLASNPINTAYHHPIKFGKSSSEEVKITQNIRSMYLRDIKESLGRIHAEPSNRVQTTSGGYYSRHAVQEPISACKEIKVPLRDSARDFGRDRAPELVVTSPAEETARWRQEQYALQILEDVQNARIAEKTRMEMEIRILKSQIASMERQVMNLDHFSEVKSRSRRR